jgi:hypothetical protein
MSGFCSNGVCSFTASGKEGQPCDDGEGCTLGDKCVAGQCVPGTPMDCDDANVCTEDACFEALRSLQLRHERLRLAGSRDLRVPLTVASGG